MPCCRSRAVLKTSINGLQFFAHHSDECATAPETIWHFQAKDLLYGTLGAFGVDPKTEVSGGVVRIVGELTSTSSSTGGKSRLSCNAPTRICVSSKLARRDTNGMALSATG